MTHLGERIKRLRTAMDESRRRLEPWRRHRKSAIQLFVGDKYGAAGYEEPIPANMLEQMVTTYLSHLAARNPKVMATTQQAQFKPFARTLELAINRLIQEIKFVDTLSRAIMEAMFCLGIVKVGLERTNTVELLGAFHDVGQPFADVVTFDDWVHDVGAHRWEEIGFCGNRYRLPYEMVMSGAAGDFDKEALAHLVPMEQNAASLNEGGDRRENSVSLGTTSLHERFIKYVELWDLWLPVDNLFVTIAADGRLDRPLREQEWNGPEGGPFHLLGFHDVPGQLMPLAPIGLGRETHDGANRILRKLIRGAERQKTVLAYQGQAEQDAKRVKDTEDGGIVAVDNPERMKEVRFTGADPQNQAFFLSLKQLFSAMAGNLDLLAGLGPQSETATQDQLLATQASQRVGAMQARVTRFTTAILRQLAWYLWSDPLIKIPLVKPIPGMASMGIEDEFSAETKEGDFLDYNIEIEPHSMAFESPASRARALMNIMQTVILPLAPMLQQRGLAVNIEGFLRKMASYLNIADLEEIIEYVGTPQMAGPEEPGAEPGGGLGPTPPGAGGPRERITRSSATQAGTEQQLMQALMAQAGTNGSMGGMSAESA